MHDVIQKIIELKLPIRLSRKGFPIALDDEVRGLTLDAAERAQLPRNESISRRARPLIVSLGGPEVEKVKRESLGRSERPDWMPMQSVRRDLSLMSSVTH
jgi:hypothetical protein